MPKEIQKQGTLNEIIVTYKRRPNGSLRIQRDFEFCPTLTEQHSAHETDLNYLIAKHRPDELAAYIAAKNSFRPELLGHDFSAEPNLQEANNVTYNLKKSFDALPDDVKMNFKNHVEFLKFIDNPANAEKMIKLGLMTVKEVKANQSPNSETSANEPNVTTTTEEAKAPKAPKA